MVRHAAFAVFMAISPATIARRLALHVPVTKALHAGLSPVAGVDEVGAGALAGPVVAAAVVLKPFAERLELMDLDDSKRLSRTKRKRVYQNLVLDERIEYAFCVIPATQVDEINVLNARLKAMAEAVLKLELAPRYVFVDGNRTLSDLETCQQQTVIGGDSSVSLIAAASIIAKVTRDEMMYAEAGKYPEYGFEKHVGYGTKQHLQALSLHGPCSIHRKTYKPIRQVAERLHG